MTHEQADTPKVLVEPTPEATCKLAAELIKTIICQAVAEHDTCTVALAGGTTPHLLYQELAASYGGGEVPWHDVHIFFGDERNVPHDHVESNYRMAQKTLLDHVPVPPNHVHAIMADSPDLDVAAESYEQIVRSIVGGQSDVTPSFDLILLGMGGDGHVASLYPGTRALDEYQKLVAANPVPVLGRNRITFTMPLINAARNVMLLVTGEDKAQVISQLLGDNLVARRGLPAARVQPEGTLFFLLDAAAAKLIRRG